MSLKEQKLFFTRNGQFSVWEKLNALNFEQLEKLYYFLFEKRYIGDYYPASNDEFPSFLYKAYESLGDSPDKQTAYEEMINLSFCEIETPKCDFNALIYHYSGVSFDLESARMNLERLKENIGGLEIVGLEMELWYYPDKNVLDVRFTSEKSSYFKENNNVQYLHTEVRVYLDYNVALMTNYSQYTHNDNEKNKFINSVVQSVSTVRNILLSPIKLSDHSLRKLIVMEDQNLPAKLKFHVEGRFKVDIDIDHDAKVKDLVSQEEIKYFYDKFPITLIRVKVRDDEEKMINLDGIDGKMFTRSQNVEPEDIDAFTEKISMLLAYDYLNVNYQKEIGWMATNNLIASNQQKDNIVNTIYKEIDKFILRKTNDVTGVFVKLVSNSFFYCLKERKVLTPKHDGDFDSKIDVRLIQYLSKIVKIQAAQIVGILNCLLELFNENQGDVAKLTLTIDASIKGVSELIQDASGQ